MFKQIVFHGVLNERTGYGIHATNFVRELNKLIPVAQTGEGDVHISMYDSVSIQNVNQRLPYPSIVYNVWESTEQPQWFIDRLKYFDQLWVASEWQKACSIAQGIPEEFVKVVPEGVDPDVYKPVETIEFGNFNFVHVGQWQPRKSTIEICQSFLKAFPDNPNIRLYLSADTLFPSDNYKSTEERLVAYGLNDSRIIPVHFEERETYIRRLQSANVFVTCARSEGWNLPLIEAMASGVVSITSDFGGSEEYAGEALNVRIRELKKPQGIYGGWDVPGQWGEPDYDHLVELMRDAYENYSMHKEKALITSAMIREKFSWVAAAKKAYAVLEELSQKEQTSSIICDVNPEQSIRAHARSLGYEITDMRPRKVIFSVDCWPSSQEKLDTLAETIKQIHSFGYPVLVTSHFALPTNIIEMADFYLYEKRDIMSGDEKAIYSRGKLDGTTEYKKCNKEYQGVACLNNFRNAIDFCRGKYDWIYQMGSDVEVNLDQWFSLVHASDKPLICIPYEGKKDGIGGGILAGRTEFLDKVFPYLNSWKQYVDMFPDLRFVVERWQYSYVSTKCDVEKDIEWIDIHTQNRFDNVDRDIWKDDQFQCHFMEGPFLNILGISTREYDVTYGNSIDGPNHYTLKQKPGMWSRPSNKFYRDWTITAKLGEEVKFHHTLSLTGQNVIISMGSKALGDTLAWIPYVEEFRKKHKCNVYLSTWWNTIMDYPEIHLIQPGDVINGVYASYNVGCHDNQPNMNPINWRQVPLQKVAADILGIDYKPIRAKLKYEPKKKGNGKETKPYICFSEFSTMQNKFWNREGAWQRVIDHLNEMGYDCVSISTEPTQLQGVVKHNGQSIDQTLTDISGAEFYVGLNAGPTWVAYSLGIPAVMITGVSEKWNDFPNPYRVSVDVGCKPCFNDIAVPIDRNWHWCPSKKDYACTREITEEMVISTITQLRKEIGHASKKHRTKTGDSHRRTSSRKTLQKKQESTQNEQRATA